MKYNADDYLRMGGILVSLAIIALSALYWAQAAADCDGVMVQTMWGFPACVETQ